ncbi:hypothetical protein JKP88DRAFT_261234 [Tribonema minus]|uniref:Uncharacterized protein n=1 Tax=Tribonema minus TaxID=303371 RepID=A0A835Z013_9STRA|nr:hypothetical protein JKP88DRAFT_261234 [Tribonema minus]
MMLLLLLLLCVRWGFSQRLNSTPNATPAITQDPLTTAAPPEPQQAAPESSAAAAAADVHVHAVVSAAAPAPSAAAAEVPAGVAEEAGTAAAASAQEVVKLEPHAIYGELVHDLGYKQIYLTSVERLVRAPIWQRQRILRPERAQAMAADKMRGKKFNGMPGVITLYQDRQAEVSWECRLAHVNVDATRSAPRHKSWDTWCCNTARLRLYMSRRKYVSVWRGVRSADVDRRQQLICESSDPTDSAIVDGQHRVAALMIMSEAGAWDKAAHNVAVDVVPTSDEQEGCDLFTEINKAEPVRLVDMPGEGAVAHLLDSDSDFDSWWYVPPSHATAQVCDLFTEINKAEPVRLVDMPGEGAAAHQRAVLAEAAAALAEAYPAMVKQSSRCKAPHINLDVFRDDIFQSELMARHKLHTTAQLLAWLQEANDTLGQRDEAQWAQALSGRTTAASSAALKKARAHGFYLGLDKAWLHI